MDKKVLMLIINPGSTSTRIAVYQDETLVAARTERHGNEVIGSVIQDQIKILESFIDCFIGSSVIDPHEIDIFVSRGGLGRPGPAGIYEIDESMCNDLIEGRYGVHASAAGPRIAFDLARKYGKIAIVVDPPSTDELDEISRFSGLPEIQRKSAFHALSHKAAARRFAKEPNSKYENLSLIIAHLGGGITVGAHLNGRVIDCTHGLSEGPFTPERTGALPVMELLDLALNGEYDKVQLKRKLAGNGGLQAYSGTTSAEELERRIICGDKEAEKIYMAMAYQISKDICSMAAPLSGKIDAVILTGGLAFSDILTAWIIQRVDFLGKVVVYKGEDEMAALASGGLRAIRGYEIIRKY